MIAIVPTGGSNLGSVRAAFARIGAETSVTEDPGEIAAASHVILPGVGHAATMMRRLSARGLVETLRGLRQPVLGICLGMQLFFRSSEESNADALPLLGLIPGAVRAIPPCGQIIPHMGWNVVAARARDPLAAKVDGRHLYFVHSYMADDGPWTVAVAEHGVAVPAVIRWGNLLGAQFHPERSGEVGRNFLRGFLTS